ncbi:hypothetical protein [Tardiphaga robiniae]|uniref:Uncharacterized protein n=1 Tax=Tardiphaga robiniae TaxID=943830 RepID=A0A7G6TY35_9BRAD|nr:hypothetical protein [Tardiphaga robiniae]QND71667.1 hypothetical protein HB776_10830 [Tardiphaga robiniae]
MTDRMRLAGVVAFVILAVLTFHICRSTVIVVASAAETAGPDPFCIQVADSESDYRPAASLFDLSELTMWAQRESGMFMQRHAVLVVGSLVSPRLFHWSYRAGKFLEETTNLSGGFGIACEPRQDFAHGLPILRGSRANHDFIRVSSTEAYRLSVQYQMHWRGSGARSSLYVIAPAPDFLPQTETVSVLRSEGKLDAQWISLSHDSEWLLRLMRSPPRAKTRYVAEGDAFGLNKTKTIFTGSDAKEYLGYEFATGADEIVDATYISCGPRSCQHRFLNKGRHFYFRHGPERVQDWKLMQERILHLFEPVVPM